MLIDKVCEEYPEIHTSKIISCQSIAFFPEAAHEKL
jgi:hypothetical protein